ncbi:MAG: hypothetical protein PHD70_10330 [Anaerostipes sp.]|jgi:hypothetical protein|nr:hypothetical protein [Anaerostipes sp.]MDD3746854.1 hypothetical protein [Anaerostipes sp.]
MKLIKMIVNAFFLGVLLLDVVVNTYGIMKVKDFFWIPGVFYFISISISWYFFNKKIFKGD